MKQKENFKNKLEELVDILEEAKESDYVNQIIPSEIDDRIHQILWWFGDEKILSENYKELADFFDLNHSRFLQLFSERMAALAVRERSKKRIITGLLALALNSEPDPREELPILSLHYHSAVKLKEDPDQILKAVAKKVDSNWAEFFLKFSKRDPKDKFIEAMGYVEAETSEGFIYKREW